MMQEGTHSEMDDAPLCIEEHVNRSDSIYALAVTRVVKTGWHSGTFRLVGALFFTVFLQLALVGVLWQVQHGVGIASSGNSCSALQYCSQF